MMVTSAEMHEPIGAKIHAPENNLNLERSEILSFQEVVAVARRYLFILLGLPIAAGALGLYYGLAQQPIYRAEALVQLDPKPTKPLARSVEVYDPGYDTSGYYHTQVKIIESRKLAERLVDRLNLTQVDEFSGPDFVEPSRLASLISKLPGLPGTPPVQQLTPDELRDRAIRKVLDSANAAVSPGTTLIQIAFASEDPKLAANAANTLADIYIEELLQARLDIYAKATEWISSKLGDVGKDLNSAEQQLQLYRDSKDLVNVGGNRSLVEDDLAESSRRLREAQAILTRLQNQNQQISQLTENPANASGAQSLLLDPVVKTAADVFIGAQSTLKTLESRYGLRHPQYIAAQAKLEEAERSYRNQLQIKARGVASELEIARQTVNQLAIEVRTTKNRLQALDRDEFQINMLERKVQSNRQLYDVFLSRFNETESSSSFSEVNARIADPAVPPVEPFSPKKKQLVLVFALLGGVLAFASIVIRQLLRTRIELPEDIESATTVPLIGVVPGCSDKTLRKSAVNYIQSQPRAPFVDALRSIKTSILMGLMHPHSPKGGGKIIAVTSAEPAEGKTTLCVALGTVLAENHRVLIIDADLRRPTLGRHFPRKNSSNAGLTDLIIDDLPDSDVITSVTEIELYYLKAGRPTPNPALLLESDRFTDLLKRLREQFDFILIDTPPVLATADALHLTKHVDGHILVARSEKTHKRAFLGMLKRLESVGAKGVGVILNGAVMRRDTYAGYYYYGSTQSY